MSTETASASERPAERAERAYGSLRAAIIEGALAPRTKLGEEALAAHYGVSRTLVRSLLSRLVRDGLVDTSKGKSAEVAHPTLDESRDAFAVRAALEREVISTLAANWSAETAQTLAAHVRAEREAWEGRNAMTSSRLGGEFHILLASATGNGLLHRYVIEVVSRTALILAIYGREIDQLASIEEHELLLTHLAQGRRDAALELAARHLAAVEQKTLRSAAQPSTGSLSSILAQY